MDKLNQVENCNKTKDTAERLVMEEDGVQETREEYFEDLYNIDTEEWVTTNM